MRRVGFVVFVVWWVAGCAAPALPAGRRFTGVTCPHVPPPPEGVARPVPPVSGFPQVLQPGAWSWTGHDYTWVPPRWLTLLARAKPLWQAGYWSANGGACVWNDAKFIRQPAVAAIAVAIRRKPGG